MNLLPDKVQAVLKNRFLHQDYYLLSSTLFPAEKNQEA